MVDESLKRAKILRQQLKNQWADLWVSKHDDKVNAEDISVKDYNLLFVEKGEVVQAKRDYRPISFSDILEKHVGADRALKVDIDPRVGGWKKFSKKNFPKKKPEFIREPPRKKIDLNQHQRKNGFGWLNQARIYRKLKDNKS
jgi:hypothetical protein